MASKKPPQTDLDGAENRPLTPLQQAYVEARLTGQTQAEAYASAGYSVAHRAERQVAADACKLETKPHIARALRLGWDRQAELAAEAGLLSQQEWLERWTELGRAPWDHDQIKPHHIVDGLKNYGLAMGWYEPSRHEVTVTAEQTVYEVWTGLMRSRAGVDVESLRDADE